MSQNFLSMYAKSFNWAGFFLPKKIYLSSSDLYDFCRTLDDIADQDTTLEIKKDNFKKYKDDFNNKNLTNPTIKKIYSLINNFKIPRSVILDLFDGIESDLKENIRLNSNKELLVYSYRVAGTVGLMMAKILNVKSRNSFKSAMDLGIAMQLTNISRDVVEDGKRNRMYINPDFETIKKTLELANKFYESSFKSIKEIPFRSRFAIIVARRVYREIGNKILSKKNMENYKNSGKIYVSNFSKVYQTFLSIFDLINLLFLKAEEDKRNEEHDIIIEEINLNERI